MQAYAQSQKLMGNMFSFTVISGSKKEADDHFESVITEIKRIESLLTTFNDKSETHLINENAGKAPVVVSQEIFALIERSIAISKITQGAFDISYGGLDKSLWNFNQEIKKLPTPDEALKRVHLINFKNIVLNSEKNTVFLKNKGMRIGFGGIGKGYAAEKAKEILIKRGVQNGIINASGDLTAWGSQIDGSPWRIGISNPDSPEKIFSYLEVSGKAVATSGNYEKFIIIDGKKYSHTIDPKTGLPISGIKSVTIISDNAEFADAMATPISVMGIKAGLYLVNQIPNLHCIIIDDENNVYSSNKINLN